ncbi:single-stranded DNA-binding protein [Faecalicoccus pleomorphus]|uniref:Single-stranded DNA-binding protein n=1 Tax=Faecalicoccus pleomorphus TaxID=1323 RepID=A0AAW6CS33_9FIRM|nr:single-stranded DNA-binding protein [Faecalicoccus pleomorphus]MDB7979532.1 single-stranded DNA-binding protein [Faecalicoccus pleomorphus]MDB7981750.1 single-stranded DNA-binding protein [Faecalicoccus pleomorphus]
MINRVVLVGRLTKDPELRKTQSGTSVVSFSLAVNRRVQTPGQPDADFINCVAWNRLADLMCQYLHRGSLIGVEGRIQTRNYENNQGQRVYVTEVVADNVQFLEPKNTQYAQSNAYGANTYAQPQAAMDPYGQAASSMPAAQDPFGADFDANDTLDISSDDLPF